MGNLQNFTLSDLAQFTKEGTFANNASSDHHLFFVGRDNVHGLLKYIFGASSSSIYLNMFGYDDEELNDIIMTKVFDPHVLSMITLDKSQAGGVHEKKLVEADQAKDLTTFNSHFVIGQSATHQISHTK